MVQPLHRRCNDNGSSGKREDAAGGGENAGVGVGVETEKRVDHMLVAHDPSASTGPGFRSHHGARTVLCASSGRVQKGLAGGGGECAGICAGVMGGVAPTAGEGRGMSIHCTQRSPGAIGRD